MIALDEAQGAYRRVLLQLLADLRQKFGEAFPEIQIRLDRDDIPDVYRLVRVDAFYKSGDKVGAGEANIKDPWLFAPLTENWNGLPVVLWPVAWNSIEFRVSGSHPDVIAIEEWVNKWMDVGDTRPQDSEGLYGVVHNLTPPEVSDGVWSTSVDFGSSDLAAFSSFIDVLRTAGAGRLEIGSFSYGPAQAT